jgi:hypothetical protein
VALKVVDQVDHLRESMRRNEDEIGRTVKWYEMHLKWWFILIPSKKNSEVVAVADTTIIITIDTNIAVEAILPTTEKNPPRTIEAATSFLIAKINPLTNMEKYSWLYFAIH